MRVTEWDDYLIHQVNRTMDTVASDSPHAMDRLWFTAYPADGSYQLMAGLCVYPNTQIMDGFLLVRRNDVQRNVRLSRHAEQGRFDTRIDPLWFEVVEPQKRWRLGLGANDLGISAELEWSARSAPYLFERANPMETATEGFSHYRQFGEASGTIEFEGETIAVDRVHSLRDRSWGVRDPHIVARMDLLLLLEANFDDFALSLNFRRQEGAILHDDGSVVRINEIRERVTFDEATGAAAQVEMLATDEHGTEHRMTARLISRPTYYTGGGYDGRHGRDLGPYSIEGERWDLATGEGFGGVFPYDAKVAEVEFDGKHGHGHLESYFSPEPDWAYRPTWQ